jgi:hypothetical protein
MSEKEKTAARAIKEALKTAPAPAVEQAATYLSGLADGMRLAAKDQQKEEKGNEA